MVGESPQVDEWILIVVAVASLLAGGLLVGVRVRQGRALLAPQRQRVPCWAVADFLLAFGLWLICNLAAIVTVNSYLGIDPSVEEGRTALALSTTGGQVALAASVAIANALVVICMLLRIGLTSRDYLRRYGLWPNWGDLRLGLLVSLLVIPPVQLLAMLLNWQVPYRHDVIDSLQQDPTLGAWAALAVGAVLVAPLVEEFLCRGLLQGGAQRAARIAGQRLAALRAAQRSGDEGESAGDEEDQTPAALSLDPYWVEPDEVASWPWWPIWLSSSLFALGHVNQGLAAIPLFLFAFALGYVYRQTGRLWPCIVVHLMLNGITMAALAGSMLIGFFPLSSLPLQQ